MTDFYDGMPEEVLELITEAGRDVKLVKPSGAIYDPVTGTYSGGAANEVTVKAVFTHYKLKDVDGELIRADDKMCLVAASSLAAEPTTSDKIKEGSMEWAVVSVKVIKPGDVALLYKIQVRR